jgi:CheY-like chemotaxis protein
MKKIEAISVIDDDPITTFGIKKMLDSLGVGECVTTYGNGKMAIDGIRNNIASGEGVPDILFLDINMPIMDGWQFLEEFIEIPIQKSVRINIVTSSIDPLDQKNFLYFKEKTHHLIEFKHKPIRQKDIEEITRAA